MPSPRLRIFFDGGCRPNPGRIEVAVVARGIAFVRDDLGVGSNTEAEWLALIHAIEVAHSLDAQNFELVGDATTVIDQATGKAKCRSEALRAHLERFRMLAGHRPPARIRWIGRAQNLAGIVLASRHPR